MKRIFFVLTILIGIISSCQNFDREFPDYDYTSGYFPYQYPVRTLVLGDYIYDNSNDNDHKFVISVAMGGVYENRQDRVFEIEVDESLCANVIFGPDGNAIQALPSNYYTLSSSSQIVIPRGKYNGGIEVQLTEAFFNDPLAISNNYVVPIRLKGSADVDTILSGSPLVANPDLRNAEHWEALPKNFTMFAIKFINELHGTYFHYGENTVKDGANTVLENNTYQAQFVEFNSTSSLVTTGKNQVSLTTFLRSTAMQGEVTMLLDFNGDNITISAPADAEYTIAGTGQFRHKEYRWGNKDRDGIVLNFTLTNGGNTYEASDVLVARDRGVTMEVYTPEVVIPD